MSTVIDSIERRQLRQGLPSFGPGDRVRVHFQVVEGNRRRTQVFEGIVLQRQGSGARETFTVRKQSFGVGVERTFPLHSPKIEKLEVAARGDVRRAKLYYLRGRIGKAARVAERRWGIDEELISAPSPRRPRSRRRSTPRASPRTRPRPRRPEATRGRGGARGGGAARSRGRGVLRRSRRPRRGEEAPEAEEAEPEAEARAEEPRPRRRPRPRPRRRMSSRRAGRRLRRGLGKLKIPKPQSTAGGLVELVVIVALALGLALGDPGVARQAVPDPLRSRWSPRSTSASGSWSTASSTTSPTRDRRHRRLPPAGGRRPGPSAASRIPTTRPARSRPPQQSDQNFIKRIVAGPGDTLASATATRSSTA